MSRGPHINDPASLRTAAQVAQHFANLCHGRVELLELYSPEQVDAEMTGAWSRACEMLAKGVRPVADWTLCDLVEQHFQWLVNGTDADS